MLATVHAQDLSARKFVASSSMHGRAHMNAIPTFYTPNLSSAQVNKYSTGPSKPNMNGSPHGWPGPGSNAAPQIDGNNIMNRTADLDSSLYQICLGLRKRLSEVPGFEQHIVEMEDEEAEADDSTDPVTSMWNCLRRGYPLMTIYNASRPGVPLEVDPSKVAESKIGKTATFKFLQACLTDLKFPANECFLITDLYGGDTTGFVKVTKVVNRVVDLLSQRGMLLRTEPGPGKGRDNEEPRTRTHRQHVVEELVKSERTYVQHLETLQHFKNQIEQTGAIPGDAVHDIFLNLNALLDFQRRFLIRIEQQNTLPESQQNWGRLFKQYKDSFRVYEPFIANQNRCNATVEKEWDKLKAAEVSLSPEVRGMVASSNVLNAFLLKPFQRLSKYPMLLMDLRKKGDLDEERRRDLFEGEAAASSVLIRANDAVDKEQRQQAVGELQSRVEDWKGHKIEHFGELLLYGDFTVLKGDGVREVEREVRMIFDALDPKSRAIARRVLAHVPALVHGYRPNKVPGLVHQDRPMKRCKLPFGLDVVPEEQSDEEAAIISLPGVTDMKLGEYRQATLKSHERNHYLGDGKLRGLHKSPMKSFSTTSKPSPLSKSESPYAHDTPGTPQSHDKETAPDKLRAPQRRPQKGLVSPFLASPSLERVSASVPDPPQNHNGERAPKELGSKRSFTSLFSKSRVDLSQETESPKGPDIPQSHHGEKAPKELRSKRSFTSLFSKSRADLSQETESPRGPDTPRSHDEEKAQTELRRSHKGPIRSSYTETEATPSPGTDCQRRPDTTKLHDKGEAPQKFRGPHKGPMKSFLVKLSATPSPKLKTPKTSATTHSRSGLSNESQITLQRSGEGSASGAGFTPLTPSRKSRSHGSGALAKFGHLFRRKTRIPKVMPSDEIFDKLRTRVLMAAELTYYFAFNGPLCNRTTFLNFERPGHPGASSFQKAWPQGKHGKYAEADLKGLLAPVSMQYKVYLFERILLCCKEINPNKQKNKMLGNNKSLLDKKGKPRLQLKGRIFMQNVTDVVSIGKAGSYSIQIFWRGDPGVEHFVVKFSNEEMMNKWRSQVEVQKKVLSDSAQSSSHNGTSETEFTYLKGQSAILQNPYQQEEDADDDYEEAGAQAAAAIGARSDFAMSRNASSTSLRSRSTTGGSGPPISQHQGRVPPPRFPIPEDGHGPPLTLHTNLPPSMSPAELAAGSSYFSPTVESPVSTRSSSQASLYPFPRQGTPGNGWMSEESKHKTAPAAVRAPSRDGQASPNSYVINGRTVQRPSLPSIASHTSQSVQQLTVAQNRMRSASSPDIQQIAPGARRYLNGQIQSTSEIVPVPPIPTTHMAQMRAPLNRSQSNSPTNGQLPFRSATQSPNLQRDGGSRYGGQYHDAPQQSHAIRQEPRPYLHSTQTTPAPLFSTEHRLMSPPLPSATPSDDIPYPSQLKVKIWFNPHPSHVTIVVPIIIKHRSLIDRIDSKMEKISHASISKGTARLRYKDADGDSVLIGSEEDVQLAIEDWGAAHEEELRAGNMADFELVWQET